MSFYILLFNMERSEQRIRPPEGTMTAEQIAHEEEARRLAIAERVIKEIFSSFESVASPLKLGKFRSLQPQAGNCGG